MNASTEGQESLAKLEEYKRKYPSVFSGKIGKMKSHQIKLFIDESVKPALYRIIVNQVIVVDS